MERVITVTVRDKIAKAQKHAYYVCGNTDYFIKFDFDDDWAAYNTKTARFKCNGTHQDVIFDGSECRVPKITDTYSFEVGVFAGDLRTTTAVYVPCKRSILCGSGSPSAPSLDVYAQIMDKLNGIEGGNVTPEAIAAAVEAYMKEHPNDGGGIDEEQLDKAVQAALKEAKESGEFDGPPGKDGEKGDKGDKGDTGPAGSDYVLTAEDKLEIAGMIPGGGGSSEGVYELIKEITVTEEQAGVTEIIETFSYGYSGMMATVTGLVFPNESQNVYASFGDVYGVRGIGDSIKTKDVLRVVCRKLSGVWDIFGYTGGESSASKMIGQVSAQNVSAAQKGTKPGFHVNFDQIMYFKLYTSGGGFPAGTTVRIYGEVII